MPTTLEMQGAFELRRISQIKLPQKLQDRKLLRFFPMVTTKAPYIIWEQKDVYKGVQHARGMGGVTGSAKRPGVNQTRIPPGYYGDNFVITEADLINLRQIANWNELRSYSDQMNEASELLTERYLNRVQLSCAQILTTGGYTAGNNLTGQQFHQDVFPIRQFTPSPLFSDLTNSAPLAFIRDVIATMVLGASVAFRDGVLLMSRPTFNLIMRNTNPADMGGKRLAVGSTINNLEDLNKYLAADDLPQIEISDEDYYPDGATQAVRYIPNGKIVLVGKRKDGEAIGEYRLTPASQNAKSENDEPKPGEWYTVEDRRMYDPSFVAFRMGHNGGPVIYHWESLAILNVAAPF